MPIIDLPLEQLQNYRGRNPKPDDFDEYWDAALGELDALPLQFDLRPATALTPFADQFHLTWTGVGGASIYAKLIRPKHLEKPAPAVVCFHGYSMDSGDWSGGLNFAACGYTVAMMDVRGQGGRSVDLGGVIGNTLNGHIIRGLEDAKEKMFYRSIFLDTAQLARIVMSMDEVDESRVGATGWSQGGALTLACAALEPKINRIAPVYPFLSDYKRVWEMDLAKKAYEELTTWFRRFDPTHAREEEVWHRLGYIDVQHLAPRIKAKTLFTTGLMDDICPPSSQFAAYNRIFSEKEMVLYPDFTHEWLPGAHDRILQFMVEMGA